MPFEVRPRGIPVIESHNATTEDRLVIELENGDKLVFQRVRSAKGVRYFRCDRDLSTPELVDALCRAIFIRRPSWGLRYTIGQALPDMELRLEGGARPAVAVGRSLRVLGVFQGSSAAYQATGWADVAVIFSS